jgi:hypothetical protein
LSETFSSLSCPTTVTESRSCQCSLDFTVIPGFLEDSLLSDINFYSVLMAVKLPLALIVRFTFH